MSEFVECQNCGRRFFAENLDCPYCGNADDEDTDTLVNDLMRMVAPSTPAPPPRLRGGIFDVLFAGFALLAAAIAVWALVGLVRAPSAGARAWLASEAAFALVTAVAVVRRRPWARAAAIAFIAWHAVLGVASLFAAGVRPFAMLGAGPIALLLFAWPFFSRQARERFRR